MMKTYFNRLISLLMVVLMLFACIPQINVGAENGVVETYTLTVENTHENSFTADDSSEGWVSFFGNTAFSGCYGNQLSGVAKELYDSLVKNYATDKKTGEYTYAFETPFTFNAEISGGSIVTNDELEEIELELSCAIQVAMDAFLYDHPEVFWLRIISSSYGISASGNSTNGYRGIIDDITITPTEIYSGASSKISQYDTAVDTAFAAITVTDSRYDTLKSIHDYICNNAYYNLVNEQRVHSSEPFFIGDGGMVCEGYAKSFKVLCARSGIPCVLVSGNAGDAHMWNYVQMDDGNWYLVDVTWDDQESKVYDTYFLANLNTQGFNEKISDERRERTDFSGTGYINFVYPILSSTEYTVHTHQWESEYTIDKAATCTESGNKSIHCATCDETKDVTVIPATNHANKTEHTQQDATCTENGYTAGVYCPDCEEWIEGHEIINKLPHSFTTYTSDNNATCTVDGTKTAKCDNCEATDTVIEVDSATGHKETTLKAVSATCTKTGLTAGKKCSVCGTITASQRVIAKTAHKEIAVAGKSATYTSTGLTAGKKCSVCGKITVAQKTIAKLTLSKVDGLKAKKVKVAKSSEITLAWNAVTGAKGYEIYQQNGSSWKKIKTTSGTSYAVKKLKSNKTYKFKVRAVVDGASGAYSSTLKVETIPATISKLTLKAGSKQLTATWKSVSDISGYEVQYSTSKKFTKKTTKTVKVKKSSKKTTIKKLKKGKKYYVRIRTYKTVDGKKIYSDWSKVKSVKVK